MYPFALSSSSRSKKINTIAVNSELRSTSPLADSQTKNESTTRIDRKHELDALRAIAMLLGIVLHAALSFAPMPWVVQDSQQSDFYYILFASIHGFRMPLFFMLSGFFTAMLWRKRGLASLINNRFKRILLPLFIGCLTIIPSMWLVSYIVSQPSSSSTAGSSLFAAVVSGDIDKVRSELQSPDSGINERDPSSGATPLCTAVFLGRTEIAKLLIDANADVNLADRSLSTPLHIAAFMGRPQEAAALLDAGADVNALDSNKFAPRDILKTDFGTTNYIATSFGLPVNEEALLAGRKQIAELLNETEYLGSETSAQSINLEGLKALLFQLPVFMHLWFLWFLCWMLAAFVIYIPIAKAIKVQNLPRWLICSPINLLWLVPLTMLPQEFMPEGTFGPSASVGLLPIPSVLAYYAIFFFFGAIYWDMDDTSGRLGRWWFCSLPVALFIVFPVALDFVSGTFGIVPKFKNDSMNSLAGCFLQVTFAWLMTFGSIGLFRQIFSRESPAMRYISDSSYWLYLTHLPLILLAQWFVRDWEIPAIAKFAGIVIVVSAFLMLTYEYGVRYTLIGKLLNGPRRRPETVET
jgi:peptidoglycan/LPS O-acetylase OafA/YrhL